MPSEAKSVPLEWLVAAKDGDEKALERVTQLVLSLPRIKKLASKYSGCAGMNSRDLPDTCGKRAVYQAVMKCNLAKLTRPGSFVGYAATYITGEYLAEYYQSRGLTDSTRKIEDKINNARKKLAVQNVTEPTLEQLAAATGLPEDYIYGFIRLYPPGMVPIEDAVAEAIQDNMPDPCAYMLKKLWHKSSLVARVKACKDRIDSSIVFQVKQLGKPVTVLRNSSPDLKTCTRTELERLVEDRLEGFSERYLEEMRIRGWDERDAFRCPYSGGAEL